MESLEGGRSQGRGGVVCETSKGESVTRKKLASGLPGSSWFGGKNGRGRRSFGAGEGKELFSKKRKLPLSRECGKVRNAP